MAVVILINRDICPSISIDWRMNVHDDKVVEVYELFICIWIVPHLTDGSRAIVDYAHGAGLSGRLLALVAKFGSDRRFKWILTGGILSSLENPHHDCLEKIISEFHSGYIQ